MIKNKVLITFVMSLFIMSILMAQTFEDVEIKGGMTTQSPFSEQTFTSSSEIGCLLTNYSIEDIKYIDFGGMNIWEDSTLEQKDFTAYLVTPNSVIDFTALVNTNPFAETLEVELNGADPHIYQTSESQYLIVGNDTQNLKIKGGGAVVTPLHPVAMTFNLNDPINLPLNVVYTFVGDTAGTSLTGFPCGVNCPLEEDIRNEFSGIAFTEMYYVFMDSRLDNAKVIYFIDSGTGEFSWIIDYNYDGNFDFDYFEIVKHQTSFQGTSAILSEPNFYDLWFEVI